MSAFHNWTQREKDALNRRLAVLHANQDDTPAPMVKVSIYDGVAWCYRRGVWAVSVFIEGKRTECGTTRNEAECPGIQWDAVRRSMSREVGS